MYKIVNKRGNLLYEGEHLTGADLRGADLRGYDLAEEDLSGADLRRANLIGTDLRGAYLHNCIGDSIVISTVYLYKYTLNITKDILFIGCQGHKLSEWLAFSDAEISRLDYGALEWWNENKEFIVYLCKHLNKES